MTPELTTLCYLEQDGAYLMLHRTKKAHDVNAGKWIGVGGHFEAGESPEECMAREVQEETGLTVTSYRFRGIVTFVPDTGSTEYMHLFTCDGWTGEEHPCNEGDLAWIPQARLGSCNLWEGDRIFLRLLADDAPFFSLKLVYRGDALSAAILNGTPLSL